MAQGDVDEVGTDLVEACTGTAGGPSGEPPLIALLGAAKDAFALEFDRRLRATDLDGVTLAHSRNILRHILHGPTRASALVDACGVSKQAVSQQIAQLQAGGYVTVEPDPSDQRARVLTLTDRGLEAQRTVHALFEAIEQDWSRDLGPEDVAALRRVLQAAIDRQGCPTE